jgi:hypothetical protein
MMSCNLPLLVWDVTHWVDRGEEHKIEATSIPYWDDRCGIKFSESSELKESYLTFSEKIDIFTPREYILENLSLEKCANNILKIIE